MTIDVGQGLLNALIFMLPVFIIALGISMYLWERTCRKKIKLIIAKTAGGVDVEYVTKEGGNVTIKNEHLNLTRTWAMSKLATIPMPYPDLAGLLPRFLQREIQTAILLEDDWEPLFNKSPHRERVASPDVVKLLRKIADATPDKKDEIEEFLANVSTSPTRELIADPATLGALLQNTIMKALATVSDDLVDAIKGLRTQLSRLTGMNPTILYIALFVIGALVGFLVVREIQTDWVNTAREVHEIHQALGITK